MRYLALGLTLLASFSPFSPSSFASSFASSFDSVVQAKGQPERLLLNGRDGRDGGQGRDGYHGSDGSNGYCRTERDRADGGDGQDGGNGDDGDRGENGSSGGDVLVQFEDPSHLRMIYIQALGGEGGRGGPGGYGGRGGRGGYGCNGGRNGFDGRDGRNGYVGSNGSQGADGTLYIKRGFEELLPSATDVSISLRQLFAETTTIRKNFWLEKSGARTLLAPGSVVSNRYFDYQRTTTLFVKGILTSDQKLSEEILGQRLSVRFNSAYTEPEITFNNDRIIVFLSREQEGDTFTYKIDSIYNSDDYFHFRAGIRGEIGNNRRILLSDLKTNWKALPTTLQVRIRGGSTFAVPSGAIRVSPYGPEILIAKVPGLSRYEGQSVSAEVVMTRNLKGRMLVRSFGVKDGL